MLETPVLFLVFNRPDLTEKVLAAIREAKPSKLFVAADGPREHKTGEAELCRETRDVVLKNIDWDCEVHTLLRDSNLGCRAAVSSAITWFFKNVESGIILEDDILPDPSFFTFCEEMLVKYKDDERITQVSGVNYMGQFSEADESYFFSKIGGIWGWATWRRAWVHYDLEIKSWESKSVKKAIKNFLGNQDWFNRIKGNFDMVYKNQYDTWDFQWVYTQMYLNGLCVTPVVNLIENLGFRHDATHTTNANSVLEKNLIQYQLKAPIKSPTAVKSNEAFTDFYFKLLPKPNSNFKTGIAVAKKNLKKILGVFLNKSSK